VNAALNELGIISKPYPTEEIE